MEKHPIESLMGVSMEQIKDMVDVNTVIGDAVQTQDGSTIIPISRVSFGFVAGGGEYAVSGAHPSDGLSGVRQERRAAVERGQRLADGARGGTDPAGV